MLPRLNLGYSLKLLGHKVLILDNFSPEAIAEKIAVRMKQRRLLQNMTQKSLAKKAGVSLGSLKRFENIFKISLDNLLKLALVLDSLDDFNNLLSEKKYSSIDEIIKNKKMKKRKRASNV